MKKFTLQLFHHQICFSFTYASVDVLSLLENGIYTTNTALIERLTPKKALKVLTSSNSICK